MKVNVISVFYNREKYVSESVFSLLNQTHNDFEILLVDDGSTDETLNELRRFSAPNIRILSRRNVGFTRALINAIGDTTSEYIAIHGSGDISYTSRLKVQSDFLDLNKEVGVVGCFCKDVGGLSNTGEASTCKLFEKECNGNVSARLIEENLIVHGAVMFRRALYHNVGGYREFFAQTQDRDLWFRLSRITDFYNVPEVLYERRRIPGGVSTSVEKRATQCVYSDFAKQCHIEFLTTGVDPLEELGPAALFFKRPSSILSRNLASMSLASSFRGNYKFGRTLARASWKEKISFTSFAALTVAFLCGFEYCGFLISKFNTRRSIKGKTGTK